jgi:2-polyprenyl-3-methyl-5-hydroxy-6-metoxy-1,4-benzoquinol methylase
MTDSLPDRLMAALLGATELFTVEIGRELGLYAALRDRPLSAAELAKAASVDERYAREWLEQQAAAGFLTSSDGSTFELPAETAAVLLDEGGPDFVGTAGEFAVGLGLLTPRVIAAFRTGEGVPYAEYGRHIRHGIAAFNRPMFGHLLTTAWLPAVPEIESRLRSTPAARVLDLGCGVGHSSVAMALAYPAVTVRGVDLDEASIEEARRTAAGVADRVSFALADAATLTADPPGDDGYDLVTIFEAVHDMGDPVGVLRACRGLLRAGGSVFVADERVGDEFRAPAGEIERLQYAFSVLHCLPATRAESPVHAHGTVLRAPTVLAWAREAGFADPEVLGIDNDFWRFYRLH